MRITLKNRKTYEIKNKRRVKHNYCKLANSQYNDQIDALMCFCYFVVSNNAICLKNLTIDIVSIYYVCIENVFLAIK